MWLFNPDAELIDERAANRDAMMSAIKIDNFTKKLPNGMFIVNGVAMSERDLQQFSQHGVNPEFCTPYELWKAEQEKLADNDTIFTNPNVNPNIDFWDAIETPSISAPGQDDDSDIPANPYCTVLDVPDAAYVPEHGIPLSFSEIEKSRREKTSDGDSNHDDDTHSI